MSRTQIINAFLYCAIIIISLLITTRILHCSKEKKAIYFVFISLLGAAALYGAITTFLDYFKFLKTEQIPNTNTIFLITVLIFITVIFVLQKEHAIYKYCLFAFFVVSAIILICLISGIKNFDYRNFKFAFFDLPLFKRNILYFLPTIVLPIFSYSETKKTNPAVLGVTAGFVCLCLMSVQAMLTLGCTNNAKTPYLNTISAITLGSLFTRLDGLVWFLFFVGAMVKVAVCVKVFLKMIKTILKK